MIVANTFEQGGTLGNNFPVLEQRLAVARLQLAQGAVKKAAPLVGRAFDQVQVAGSKQNNLHLPYQFNNFFRDRVDLDAFARCIGR